MLAIITGTIRPNGQVGQLVLKNEAERLQQYKDALLFTVQSKAFTKVIFCENSAYNMECLTELKEEATKCEVELELLSFAGNIKNVLMHGKGYGEGEIMDYVFANSKLLQNEPYFVKITGRLKIVNIKNICRRLCRERCYFNIPNRTIRDFYDTRLYAMPTAVFTEYFRNVYTEVWDNEGIYLEKVYTKILEEKKIRVKNFPRFPRIIGISGSLGYNYGYTEWKCKIKDVISFFDGYKIQR